VVIQSVERPMGTQLLPPPITGNMIMDSEFMITNAIKNDQYGLPSAGIHTHTHTHIQNSCTLVGEDWWGRRSHCCCQATEDTPFS